MTHRSSAPARGWAALLATALLATVLTAQHARPAAAATTLAPGFTRTSVDAGQPPYSLTNFALLPGGGMITTGKSGTVAWVGASGAVRQLLTIAVDDRGDLGLAGLALARDYAASGGVYTLYPYHGPGGTVARLSRWTAVNPAAPTALTGERVLLDGISVENTNHAATDVVVAPDGSLFVTMGDSSSFNYVDPMALRAQDPADPHGKVLHVSPTGAGLPGNPFYDGAAPDSWKSRVYALGFRSPFRLALRPGSGSVYVGDVGWNSAEEIDVVRPGGNYGWPCLEGPARTAGYQDLRQCQDIYRGSGRAPIPPLWSYFHSLPPGGGASVTGGVFAGSSYPDRYDGAYVFGDFSRQVLWTLRTDAADRLVVPPEAGDPATTTGTFGADIGGPVAFRTGPGGDVYYADILTGKVWRVSYVSGNRPPVAVASADSDASTRVSFHGEGSYDPNGDPLGYRWDFGDGTTSAEVSPVHYYGAPGRYTAVLTVTDPAGTSGVARITVVPGNRPPELRVTAPPRDARFAVGQRLQFSASADDRDDGGIPASRIRWAVTLAHCPGGVCHLHPGTTGTGSTFSVTFSDHGGDTSQLVTATVTDSAGATTTSTYLALPQLHRLAVVSSPPGVPLDLDGSTTALNVPLTTGSGNSVAAPLQYGDLVFDSWSDRGARAHTFGMPGTDTVLAALYKRAGITSATSSEPATGITEGSVVTLRTAVALPPGAELALSAVRVTNSACSPGAPVGDNGNGRLERGETWTYSCTHRVRADERPQLLVGVTAAGRTAGGVVVASANGASVPPTTAILQRYDDLGSAGSFLGRRLSDEYGVPGGRAEDFQSGTIYWSPPTGAQAVLGAIRGRYLGLGGSASVLGLPVSDEYAVPGGRASSFQGGTIFWSAATGAQVVYGAILGHYGDLSGPASILGLPIGEEYGVPGGRAQDFQGGTVYWSPGTGAREAHGLIEAHYLGFGGPGSFLGMPTSDEYGVAGGRAGDFQGATIYWSTATDPHAVQGAIRDRYRSIGDSGSNLGLPVTDEQDAPGGRASYFQRGAILWDGSTGTTTVIGG